MLWHFPDLKLVCDLGTHARVTEHPFESFNIYHGWQVDVCIFTLFFVYDSDANQSQHPMGNESLQEMKLDVPESGRFVNQPLFCL